jgi:hypothetical protein
MLNKMEKELVEETIRESILNRYKSSYGQITESLVPLGMIAGTFGTYITENPNTFIAGTVGISIIPYYCP